MYYRWYLYNYFISTKHNLQYDLKPPWVTAHSKSLETSKNRVGTTSSRASSTSPEPLDLVWSEQTGEAKTGSLTLGGESGGKVFL